VVPRTTCSRRSFLKAGGLSLVGSGLGGCVQWGAMARTEGPTKKAKACILIFLTGGPAQQETFDPKPDAPEAVRGEFKPIDTSVPGIRICEHLPLLAREAHRYTIIRSLWHDSNGHGVAAHWAMTGMPHAGGRTALMDRRDSPCMGAVIRKVRGDRNGMPAAIQFPLPIGDHNDPYWAGQHAGVLGPRHDPLFLFDEAWLPGDPVQGFDLPEGVDAARQQTRAQLLEAIQPRQTAPETERDYERFQRQALAVGQSGAGWRALRLDGEAARVIERYGDNRFGRSCLVARRLVEAGVSFVTVTWMHKHLEQNFDTHSRHFPKMKDDLLPPMDRGVSALLSDLDERGMLNDTLVVCTGEFGRTPKINDKGGRDHHGAVYSALLAGAGVHGGRVHGRSDKQAERPAADPVHVSDLIATIYYLLGHGEQKRVVDMFNRPIDVIRGEPVAELIGA
jgi:hypothetical protein